MTVTTHLTPDELQELWTELRIELKRIGARPVALLDEPAGDMALSRPPPGAVAYESFRFGTDWPPEPPDVSAAVTAARESRAPERVLRILEAISRMRTGTYGICTACRDPIPFSRLLAIPETTTCMGCGDCRTAPYRRQGTAG